MKGALTRFLRENQFDVICMQEAVWSDQLGVQLKYFVNDVSELREASGLEYEFKTSNWGIDVNDGRIEQGNVILSRFPFIEQDAKIVHGNYYDVDLFDTNDHAYYAQRIVLPDNTVVINYHGYWKPDPLGDEETVRCMKAVADMIRDERRPVIMCGDLNVIAESPAMRELDFLHDLTAENHVKTTLANIKFIKDVACDHILINEKLTAQNFTVHQAIITDHLPVSVEVLPKT